MQATNVVMNKPVHQTPKKKTHVEESDEEEEENNEVVTAQIMSSILIIARQEMRHLHNISKKPISSATLKQRKVKIHGYLSPWFIITIIRYVSSWHLMYIPVL